MILTLMLRDESDMIPFDQVVQVAHMVIEDHLITELKIDNTRICEKTKAAILNTVAANAQNGSKNPRKNASVLSYRVHHLLQHVPEEKMHRR